MTAGNQPSVNLPNHRCSVCGEEWPTTGSHLCKSPPPVNRGMIANLAQRERPPHLRYHRMGIHDHHLNAARTAAERASVQFDPLPCYDDERCWWDGGEP